MNDPRERPQVRPLFPDIRDVYYYAAVTYPSLLAAFRNGCHEQVNALQARIDFSQFGTDPGHWLLEGIVTPGVCCYYQIM